MSADTAEPERRDLAARLCSSLPAQERDVVVPLLRFRIWEKAQPGSRPVDANFWTWFRDKLRSDPHERAKTLARLALHEDHVAELAAIRAKQAAKTQAAATRSVLPDFSAQRNAELAELVEEARRRRNRT